MPLSPGTGTISQMIPGDGYKGNTQLNKVTWNEQCYLYNKVAPHPMKEEKR